MPFITNALSPAQLNAIRKNGYVAQQHILFAPNTVVFQARVNQASFTDSFVHVDYDTVTIGVYTAIHEGFTVYIGATSDIRQASFIGYIRRDNAGVVATATSININQTSAEIGDDWFITVTKDVRLWYKLPRWIDSTTYYKDWSITFRRLRPLITGMQTAYVKVLSGGVADFAFSPQASALDADATSTFTWVWDADGGTFQSGTSTSKNVTLRYTVAGHYMPRLTVTDSNGVSNWLTCHVFVVPADYTSVVSTGADGARIDYDIETGNNATIRFFEGVENIPDYTFCAVWSPNNLSAAYTSDIVFVGRLRNEQIEAIRDPIATYTPRTSFQLEGFATELGRLFNAGKVALKNVASPARFDEIKQLTPARGLGYYLSEHTTLTNIASLSLDDLSSSHQVHIYPIDQASVLDQCQRLLNTVNRVLEYAPTGEIATVRKAIYLSSSARNALTTILQITLRDMQVSASGGAMYTISGDMVNTVGRLRASGGVYNEATRKYQAYQAITPAVAPTDGDDSGILGEQILASNTVGFAELGERCAHAFAEAQPPTLITVNLLPSYAGLIPSANKWYTFDIPDMTNNRGVMYTASERWLLQSLSVEHDNATGFPSVTGIFRLETVGDDYQTVVFIPPNTTEYTNPIMPIDSVYPNLPSDPTAPYPDPDNIQPEDMPPFTSNDIADSTRPTQPGTNQEQQETGLAGMAWASGAVYAVNHLGTSATFADVTPSTLSGFIIQDGKLSRHDNKGYVLASDEANASRFFRTNAFGGVDYAKTDLIGDYRLIRTTSTAGALYLLSNAIPNWIHVFDFTDDAYTDDWDINSGSGEIIPTTYIGGIGYQGRVHSSAGHRYNSARIVTEIFSDTYITQFDVYYEITNPTLGTLDDTSLQYQTGLNGSLSGVTTIGLGSSPIVNSYTATVNLTRDYLLLQLNGARRLGTNNPNGKAIISKVVMRGTGVNPFGGASAYHSRYTNNHGASWADAVSITPAPTANGGFDTQVIGNLVFASADAKIQQASSGGAYSDSSGSGTAGTYARCIVAYGESGTKFIMATPVSVSGESVWKVVGGSPTAITPNDGVSDGLAVSPNCIAMADGIETHIIAVLSFGGVRKLAYSVNGGATWSFNTQVSNNAHYIRMIRIGTLYYVAVCDGGTLWWGVWDGVGSLTLYAKTAPQSLKGFEFR